MTFFVAVLSLLARRHGFHDTGLEQSIITSWCGEIDVSKKDPRVDTYISKSAPFARPILHKIRGLVHRGCPPATETIKWGMPFFEQNGILCFMAAFKAHCAFGFWRGRLDTNDLPAIGAKDKEAMGQFGRLTSPKDLPSDKAMLALIRQAAASGEATAKSPARRSTKTARPVVVPTYIMTALKKNKKAHAAFTAFSPSHQREYVEWITGAKKEETRLRRLAQAVVWLAEGKPQSWRYEKK